MKENRINEDQLETIISDFVTYCFRDNLTYEKLIECGFKALELANKFGINVKLLSEYLTQAKTKLQRLEEQKQEVINTMVKAQEDTDIARAELEKIGGGMPLVEQNRELKNKLKKAKSSEANLKLCLEGAIRPSRIDAACAERLHRQSMDFHHQMVEMGDELNRIKEETALSHQVTALFALLAVTLNHVSFPSDLAT